LITNTQKKAGIINKSDKRKHMADENKNNEGE
jgi:hypothetical protein